MSNAENVFQGIAVSPGVRQGRVVIPGWRAVVADDTQITEADMPRSA